MNSAGAQRSEEAGPIALHGPLDQAQRERLLQIANRCPVHRTLTSEIRISTRLAA
jgi:putative redox protein